MGDIDSAGVYFLSVEEFESRTPAEGDAEARDSADPEDQPAVDATKSAITRPSSSPRSS
jgi:hypothetical protein